MNYIPNPPRIAYNEKIANDWLASKGITSTVPPVSEQFKSITINSAALHPFGYNPSLAMRDGQMVMAYRYHANGMLNTKLALAELDSKFNVLVDKEISIPGTGSQEDPRFFHWKGSLWLSWVESKHPEQHLSVVKYGRLEGATIKEQWQVQYGQNTGSGMEKNWSFFESNQKLFCIHSGSPKQTVLQVEDDKVIAVHESEPIHWPYGSPRGGAQPLAWELGSLVRFFHSSLDNEPFPYVRRYYVGAMLMESDPPFKPLSITRKPLIIGSEADGIVDAGKCVQYKKQVVFPCGVVPVEEGYCLSVGVNDSACAVLLITRNQVKEALD